MANGGLTEIGKYRIIGQIGEGAMGVVYRALDPVLNRAVAIKVMSDALARDDELRNRFLREAQAAGSLQHPNVITIYDFGEVEGHLYIAMEFVGGDDLEDLLIKRTPLTPLQKVDILIDVLGGLAYAHKRGIVHRDIKPANIRIDEDGRARIMDFGIAHLSSSKMTKTGIMVGTPAYMAPEQIVGGAIVPATDLFSVGAVMYELLTGKKPFAAESLQSVFYKIVSAPAPSLLIDAPGLPPALDTIVQKSLAKDPADRYSSALEMANALTSVRSTLDSLARQSKSVSLRSAIETGLASRPTMPPQVQPNRSRTAIYAGGGAVALLLVLGFAYSRMSSTPTPPPVVPPPPVSAPSRTEAPAGPAASAALSPVVPTGAPSTPSSAPSATRSAAPNKPLPSSADAAQSSTARDRELFRAMQATTLDGRRRAADAGATADQLQAGDDYNKRATVLAGEGKVTEAVARLNLAATAWSSAERDARAAAAAAANAAAARSRLASDQPKVEPAAPVTPAPIAAAPQAAPAPVVHAPAANPSAEIAAVVAAYAHAIDTRDVNEVKRAYPGATPAQASGFEQFFSTLRSLHATFALSGLDVQAASAEGRITGSYDYVTTAGKSERQPLDFQASFRRDGTAWKLVSVRANK